MRTGLKTALFAALALTGSAAFAVDHEVRLERYGFFPKTIYVSVGDTITFVNRTPNWARVYSSDSNDNWSGYDWNDPCGYLNDDDKDKRFSGDQDGWATGWMSVGSSRQVTVTPCMETTLLAPYVYQYPYSDNKYRGGIVFGSAP